MTQEQLQHAAKALLGTAGLIGEGMYLPKAFIVDGKPYWFLNAARRAAYGTNLPIEVMTIEYAWKYGRRNDGKELQRNHVAWQFDQTGATFEGRLFVSTHSPLAGIVTNPIIVIDL